MEKRARRQRGFTLALSMFVSVVVMMLAGGLIARILTDLKGAKTSALVAGMSNDADIGLNLAEVEIFRDLDILAAAIWTVATNDFVLANDFPPRNGPCPDAVQATSNAGCVPSDVYLNSSGTMSYGSDPLRNLDLLGNARNWPPFCNWAVYLSTASIDPPGGYQSTDGVGWTPTKPATTWWAANDVHLTNGWWYVPRKADVGDVADTKYYTWDSNNNSHKDMVFPMTIAGEKPNNPQTGKYRGDNSVKNIVTTDFWYDKVLPIYAAASDGFSIPSLTVWPNAEFEYGGDTKINGTDRSDTGVLAPLNGRKVWNTPFYKKIYRLPDGRKVAVYVRLDLRDYFPPITTAGTESWDQPAEELGKLAYKSKYNFLKFFVAAVPEGRMETVPGTTTKRYKPAEMRTKYILVKTLGAWNRSMAISDLRAPYKYPEMDDHQFPAVLGTANGVLRQGTDIRGQVFRADANRGFDWESLKPMTKVIYPGKYARKPKADPWSPVASERYVYLYEQIATRDVIFNRPATATFFIWASYSLAAVNQQTKPARILTNGWTFHRIDLERLLATSGVPSPGDTLKDGNGALYFGPDLNWDYPCYDTSNFQVGVYDCNEIGQDVDASTSFESSFSAIVDASGSFTISAASGWSPEKDVLDPRFKVPMMWRGPAVDTCADALGNPATCSRIYFTTNVPWTGQYHFRRSFRYDSTESLSGMR